MALGCSYHLIYILQKWCEVILSFSFYKHENRNYAFNYSIWKLNQSENNWFALFFAKTSGPPEISLFNRKL
jgi:hypothetical protein